MNFQFRCSNVTAAQTFTVVSLRRALLLVLSSDESDHLWLWARIDNGRKTLLPYGLPTQLPSGDLLDALARSNGIG